MELTKARWPKDRFRPRPYSGTEIAYFFRSDTMTSSDLVRYAFAFLMLKTSCCLIRPIHVAFGNICSLIWGPRASWIDIFQASLPWFCTVIVFTLWLAVANIAPFHLQLTTDVPSRIIFSIARSLCLVCLTTVLLFIDWAKLSVFSTVLNSLSTACGRTQLLSKRLRMSLILVFRAVTGFPDPQKSFGWFLKYLYLRNLHYRKHVSHRSTVHHAPALRTGFSFCWRFQNNHWLERILIQNYQSQTWSSILIIAWDMQLCCVGGATVFQAMPLRSEARITRSETMKLTISAATSRMLSVSCIITPLWKKLSRFFGFVASSDGSSTWIGNRPLNSLIFLKFFLSSSPGLMGLGLFCCWPYQPDLWRETQFPLKKKNLFLFGCSMKWRWIRLWTLNVHAFLFNFHWFCFFQSIKLSLDVYWSNC